LKRAVNLDGLYQILNRLQVPTEYNSRTIGGFDLTVGYLILFDDNEFIWQTDVDIWGIYNYSIFEFMKDLHDDQKLGNTNNWSILEICNYTDIPKLVASFEIDPTNLEVNYSSDFLTPKVSDEILQNLENQNFFWTKECRSGTIIFPSKLDHRKVDIFHFDNQILLNSLSPPSDEHFCASRSALVSSNPSISQETDKAVDELCIQKMEVDMLRNECSQIHKLLSDIASCNRDIVRYDDIQTFIQY
jgi:hypothetical protein